MKIGEILLANGVITQDQLSLALSSQKERKEKKKIGEVLSELGYLTEKQCLDALSSQLNIPFIDLSTSHIDSSAVARIPKQIAVKYKVIAIKLENNELTVAVNDPVNLYAIEDIRLVTNMRIRLVLAVRQGIDYAVDLYYSELDARSAVQNANQNARLSGAFYEESFFHSDNQMAPVVRLLNSLLMKGYNTNVSDIHIEPSQHETAVRMRRDGMLLPYITLSPTIHQSLIARIKIMAQMDIAEKRKPQDGHFHVQMEDISIHIRVSFIPTPYGEKGVLRYLTTNTRIDYSESFGMNAKKYKQMLRLIEKPDGLIYLTGPTGSGKTTTLYSILSYLSKKPVNIAAIEDPIERNVPGLSQMEVNPKAGITFELGLRALLRQDPDILMVGETRDLETAIIAARAAMTGHLVLSTLHTNDAVSTAIRLLELGLPPYVAATALAGVVAQRLIRKLCVHCQEEYEADIDTMDYLFPESHPEKPVILNRSKGCHLCDYTGYRGRTAIFEIMEIDRVLSRMITESRPVDEMYRHVRAHIKMSSLQEEVRLLVLDGITDINEMRLITRGLERW